MGPPKTRLCSCGADPTNVCLVEKFISKLLSFCVLYILVFFSSNKLACDQLSLELTGTKERR